MPSAAPLVKVYIDALCARAICVHSALNGRAARIGFDPLPKKGMFAKLWFARPAHAELVMLRCVGDFEMVRAMRGYGWVDLPPAEVIDKIKATAALLGAKWQTQGQIERDAEKAVADIVARVRDAQRDGGLREVNVSYKAYRQLQISKGEPAIPYNAHLHHFMRALVIKAATESMQPVR